MLARKAEDASSSALLIVVYPPGKQRVSWKIDLNTFAHLRVGVTNPMYLYVAIQKRDLVAGVVERH